MSRRQSLLLGAACATVALCCFSICILSRGTQAAAVVWALWGAAFGIAAFGLLIAASAQ
jgi:hypothetical protein